MARTSRGRVEVICEGSAHALGVAQGAALQARIHEARRALSQLEALRLRQPWWLPYPLYRWIAGRKASRFLEAPLRETLPEMGRRLDGLAEGARMGRDALYLLNALEGVMSSGQESTVIPPAGGCSAVAVRASRSATGEPILAHNFDYLPLVQPFYVVRESRPAGRLASLDFTLAPLCGAVDGVNEKGLCIAYDYAYGSDTGVAAPTISMVIAEALGCCGTVAEAAELIAACPRWGAGLLMLADAAGDIASLELSNTKSRLRRPDDGSDVMFHSNMFHTPDMKDVEVSRHAVYDHRAPAALRGVRVLEASEVRDERFCELLQARERLGPDDLAAIMADHGAGGQPNGNTICMHGSYWQTTACLQLLPHSRKMRVAYDSACAARGKHEELALSSAPRERITN